MRPRKQEGFPSVCEINTRQSDGDFNEFNNETSRMKILVEKQNQVMLLFYLNFKATNLKYNSRFPQKLARYEAIWHILDNLTVIPMSSFDSRVLCAVKSLTRAPL